MFRSKKSGFTLIELLVTISLIVILIGIAILNFGPAREKARDSQRKTDLRTVEAALTLYKNKYGRYPEACNGPTTGGSAVWSGEIDTDHECTSGTGQFITGLAPEFLPKLPTDPRRNGNDSGYVYAVNDEGSVYKFMALNTVETEVIGISDEFSRCDSSWNLGFDAAGSYSDPGICRRTPTGPTGSGASSVVLGSCNTASRYNATYAVSAGFSTDDRGNANKPERGMEYDTESVRCG